MKALHIPLVAALFTFVFDLFKNLHRSYPATLGRFAAWRPREANVRNADIFQFDFPAVLLFFPGSRRRYARLVLARVLTVRARVEVRDNTG